MISLTKWFRKDEPNEALLPLYRRVVEAGREPHWYREGAVPDTIDGRFEMIAALLSLVLLRLETEEDCAREEVWLTELFVEDMDGQLRQIGIGDYVVGKHVGRLMSALGGRLGALRAALTGQDDLGETIVRNVFRGEAPEPEALAYVERELRRRHAALAATPAERLLAGDAPL